MTDRESRRAEYARNTEYRIAHLQERLAGGGSGELGMRIEDRGGTVTVTGTVPTARCREAVLRIVDEELAGLPVLTDIAVADADAPDRPEELA